MPVSNCPVALSDLDFPSILILFDRLGRAHTAKNQELYDTQDQNQFMIPNLSPLQSKARFIFEFIRRVLSNHEIPFQALYSLKAGGPQSV